MSQRSRNLTLYRRAQGERQAHTKPTFRGILGGTLFDLGKVFKDRAAEVAAIRINATGGASLAIALLLTAIAHTWAVWVWS